MHAMLRDGTEFARLGHQSTRQETASSSQEERRPREGADDGADIVAWAYDWPTAISTEPPCTQLTPSSAERARREHRHPKASTPRSLPPLTPFENMKSPQIGGGLIGDV